MSLSVAIPDAPPQRTSIDSYICWPSFADLSFVKPPAGSPSWPIPLPTPVDAIDDLRFDAIAEDAEIAEGLARQVGDAADRGERLRVRAFAGLLSRAVRNLLLTVSELGSAS